MEPFRAAPLLGATNEKGLALGCACIWIESNQLEGAGAAAAAADSSRIGEMSSIIDWFVITRPDWWRSLSTNLPLVLSEKPICEASSGGVWLTYKVIEYIVFREAQIAIAVYY